MSSGTHAQVKKRQVISNTKPKSAAKQPVPATIAAMQASLTINLPMSSCCHLAAACGNLHLRRRFLPAALHGSVTIIRILCWATHHSRQQLAATGDGVAGDPQVHLLQHVRARGG